MTYCALRDFVFCEVGHTNHSQIKRASWDEERGKTKEPTDGTLLLVNDRGRLLFCEVIRPNSAFKNKKAPHHQWRQTGNNNCTYIEQNSMSRKFRHSALPVSATNDFSLASTGCRFLCSLKGGDPAAPSDTATLLRLHPSH